METNAGRKIIDTKGVVESYGKVWFDEKTVSNLFSLSDVVKREYTLATIATLQMNFE